MISSFFEKEQSKVNKRIRLLQFCEQITTSRRQNALLMKLWRIFKRSSYDHQIKQKLRRFS